MRLLDWLTAWIVGLVLYHHVPEFRAAVDRQVAADAAEREALRRL